MKFSVVTHIDADISRILHVLPSQELANARAQHLGLTQYTFTTSLNDNVDPQVDSVTSALIATIDATKFPAQLRTLLPNGLNVTIETQQLPAGDGANIHYDVTIKGAPVNIDVVAKIVRENATTTLSYMGEVKVHVPFLGGGVEKKVVAQLPKVLERDARIIENTVKTFGTH
ncbi:DUF2505 domain-containing protein [Arcanobacterium bovis]|uniref:DUF2505 domain-containing protein n=1 Tax=Arcanobacterium bovis TaxID=2529275 RepID=A0A4V2KQY7_9ACTO|nr:DUF2505 domain-containing protein [Arcanobacterium bovis]TBW20805.1 DUF2505 domain-containing protein [Arcanobacterium bovis]